MCEYSIVKELKNSYRTEQTISENDFSDNEFVPSDKCHEFIKKKAKI